MKRIVLSFIWIISIALAFLLGKNFDEQQTIVKVETHEKIVYKDRLKVVESSSKKSKLTKEKTKSKDKKETTEQTYYKRKTVFLTDENLQEEAIIDCRNGDEAACWKIEELYKFKGQRKKLKKQLSESCFGEKVSSCNRLYYLEENTQKKKKIKSKLKMKCEENNAKACVSLGSILENGDIKIDQKAFELREKGCDLDPKTCASLGHSLRDIKDPRAGSIFLKACEAGGDYSCMSASDYYFENGSADKGGDMLRIGCDQSQSYECRKYYEYLLANNRGDEATSFKKIQCGLKKTKIFFSCI